MGLARDVVSRRAGPEARTSPFLGALDLTCVRSLTPRVCPRMSSRAALRLCRGCQRSAAEGEGWA